MNMQRLLRLLSIFGLFAISALPGYAAAESYNVTGIVNFFCEHAGKNLAVLAWRDKTNGVPISMHRPALGFINHLDNEIMQMVYRQPLTEDDARREGFRICVAMMVSR